MRTPSLADGLPIAELAPLHAVGLPLSDEQIAPVHEAWLSPPRRSRYVVTVRLGLGTEARTLAATAKPLGLHLSRVRQLHVLALDSLAQAAAGGERGRPDPGTPLEGAELTLRALAHLSE